MRQIVFRLPDGDIDRLDTLSAAFKKSRSVVIREIITDHLLIVQKTNPQVFQPYTFKSIHDESKTGSVDDKDNKDIAFFK
jgi:hypothetical protein